MLKNLLSIIWKKPFIISSHESRTVSVLELFFDLVFVSMVSFLTIEIPGLKSFFNVLIWVAQYISIWIIWFHVTRYMNKFGNNDTRVNLYVCLIMFVVSVMGLTWSHITDFSAYFFGTISYIIVRIIIIFMYFQLFFLNQKEFPELKSNIFVFVGSLIAISNAFISLLIISWFPFNDALLKIITIIWIFSCISEIVSISFMLNRAESSLERKSRRPNRINLFSTDHFRDRLGIYTIIFFGEMVLSLIKNGNNLDLFKIWSWVPITIFFMTIFLYWWHYETNIHKLPIKSSAVHWGLYSAVHLIFTIALLFITSATDTTFESISTSYHINQDINISIKNDINNDIDKKSKEEIAKKIHEQEKKSEHEVSKELQHSEIVYFWAITFILVSTIISTSIINTKTKIYEKFKQGNSKQSDLFEGYYILSKRYKYIYISFSIFLYIILVSILNQCYSKELPIIYFDLALLITLALNVIFSTLYRSIQVNKTRKLKGLEILG